MKFTRGRLILIGAALAGAVFALQGGQFSTIDLLGQRSRIAKLSAALDSLRVGNDSLLKYRKALATDVRLQERIAREEWGMVKEGERLYRMVEGGK
jgi:cell division protein FtsB